MTSSAAGIIDRHAPPEVRERFLPHLTTMDFDEAWDGAMFMTEIRGGSDLASSECSATKTRDGWRVNGSKWFCSNLDAEAILDAGPAGGRARRACRASAMFLVPKRRADGTRNGIHIRRLKDKLGTKAVPTGEVDFEDAEAYLMGAERHGRRHGRARRPRHQPHDGDGAGLALRRRDDGPRHHAAQLPRGGDLRAPPHGVRPADRGVPARARDAGEHGGGGRGGLRASRSRRRRPARAHDDESRRLYRILVPLAKFRCARRGVDLASQAVEMHGGNGYIENWPVARQLRDAQCHTIWEGTENIICLDVLRAMQKERADEALFARVERALGTAEHPALAATRVASRPIASTR